MLFTTSGALLLFEMCVSSVVLCCAVLCRCPCLTTWLCTGS
jgi:hypothetical protein